MLMNAVLGFVFFFFLKNKNNEIIMEVSCLCLLREGSLERDTQVYNLVREMELTKTKKILVYERNIILYGHLTVRIRLCLCHWK